MTCKAQQIGHLLLCSLVLGVWMSSHFELVDIGENFKCLKGWDHVLRKHCGVWNEQKGKI